MTKETIALGADHAGYELKAKLKSYLEESGYEVRDYGTHSTESVDYPDYVHPLSKAIDHGDYSRGVLICGSANGVAMSANKYQNVRAAIAWSNEISELARQHNNANILCLPSRYISEDEAKAFLKTFLDTAFEGGRHARRVEKIACT